MANAYTVLGCSQTATADELRQGFRAAVLRTHPDRGGSKAALERVVRAWACLGTPDARAAYDRKLAALEAGQASGKGQGAVDPRERIAEGRKRAKAANEAVISLAEALGLADPAAADRARRATDLSLEASGKFFELMELMKD